MSAAATNGIRHPQTQGLAAALRRARDLVAPLQQRIAAARRASDLLERDLLPRTAGGDAYLVCGIVGPNNAGKSALFNSLLGRDMSPSVPAGGATRRLVGAAAPALLAALRADPALARFRIRPIAGPVVHLEEALQPAADPAELLVAADAGLPAGLMLIDTPDFDSVLHDNRLASESLLAVADLVIAVVTRHTYQNREVVRFLEHWFDHGRPWMLVYNEAINDEVARSHAAKLVADVGHPPLATFWAPHSLDVQQGTAPLVAQRLLLDGASAPPAAAEAAGGPAELRSLLFDMERVAEVKAGAFVAALARLSDDLDGVAAAVSTEATRAREVLAVAEAHAAQAGRHVAETAMPAGPFVEAFRAVLDRRTNVLSRRWRAMLRAARLRLEDLVASVRGTWRLRVATAEALSLDQLERAALRQVWSEFWEESVRDHGPEARHEARQHCPADVAALLDADLADHRRAPALERAVAVLGTRSADLEAFRGACEDFIEQAIDERGFDLDIQAAADLASLAPLALAAAVIVKTGGLGMDLAIAGGGAVSSFLMEKYSHLLGGGIVAEARRRWADLRGSQVASALSAGLLESSGPMLRGLADSGMSLAVELRGIRADLS